MATGTPCYKVILCGEYGVGKSSMFRRFMDNSFTQNTGPTSCIGLDHFTKVFKYGEREVKLELWDTAGIERFATLSASYFQSASAAILCYSVDDRESFGFLSQHILDIIMHSETAKIFLCGNKTDLGTKDEVQNMDIQDFQLQCDTVLSGTYRISCKSGEGVKEMFQDIAKTLVNEVRQKFDPNLIQPRKEDENNPKKGVCCTSSSS